MSSASPRPSRPSSTSPASSSSPSAAGTPGPALLALPAGAPDIPPSADPLVPLGWDESWRQTWADLLADAPTGAVPGRVARSGRGRCDVLVATHDGAVSVAPDDGVVTVTAAWAPALERAVAADPVQVPAAGDWVVVVPVAGARTGAVERVLPRRTAVVRAQVARGSSYGQVLAANADVVAVAEGMAPDVDLARIERLLALAWSSGAEPYVVLTKADLPAEPDVLAAEVAEVAPGAPVLAVSALTGAGLEPLRDRLRGGATVALVGASGAGKSTLLNALVGGDVMSTRALRVDGKGRHTTVTRELHLVPGGGAVLDTPGLRTIGLAGEEALDDVFAEIEDLASRCRFADCAHRTEPGCAVLAAVEDGTLPQRRLDSHRKLLRELEHQAARVDSRLRAELTGRARVQQRAYRRYPLRP
ncbi:GTPase RsgA [Actinotalea ferrariae CF5-4]|uniref:Small ribosomal subunit biogenesis GTPase RsgA n=1 Tax=Actinotalea ferrariae CF5-4 TaxID=948458 RepID=A0A021VQQ6_9CELL|nr:ribosome small subunit-dependent GTPase A [Actinotalea ferrariae]EYR63481.1 GTPase RsgA [Actinotalea ferrariae CF5-4]